MENNIVVGAGLWGCTVARRLAEAGREVLLMESRAQIGGNVRSEIDSETGIEIHRYGPHIFHTSIPAVRDFVRRFTDFNAYQHHVLATAEDGKVYQLPLGLPLINKFFGLELKPKDVSGFMADEAHAKAVFDAFFRGYTSKQWGRPPEEVDGSIIKRIPVRDNYDLNYYRDYLLSGIPLEGYNKFFQRLVDHENIHIQTGRTFELDSLKEEFANCRVYYSGPIDRLFDYRFGALPWRSLRFEVEILEQKDYQGASQMNFPSPGVPFTRIVEYKHFHPERKDLMSLEKTVIVREYPLDWKNGDEPYYPIDNEKSRLLLQRYQQEASKYDNLVVGGRLGDYKYYDMDKTIDAALRVDIGGVR